MKPGSITPTRVLQIQQLLLDWYRTNGRTHLPWRITRDPYAVIVSEFMLQQTQVERVLPKFKRFIELFPTLESLANSSTAEVLRAWRGLGYNSRAVRLKKLATGLVNGVGKVPRDVMELRKLPGVGAYTVAAIRAFAHDEDDAALDTNVRRVVHRILHGLEYPARATPAKINLEAQSLVPEKRGHAWNSALMDLGSTICTARAPKCLLCPLRSVCSAAPIDPSALETARRRYKRKRSPQERIPFRETTRFLRGRVIERLRQLSAGQMISLLDLQSDLQPHLGKQENRLRNLVGA
ncbi:MAG: A/G-specific adenine glycosylase, partial [Candidatus Eremiobacteraeota bacterium]|nr:A/G-specific adenine glycosylase [Candidatus Eremiobacteraeota bacterium]